MGNKNSTPSKVSSAGNHIMRARAKINLVGYKFGRWTVLSFLGSKNRNFYWEVVCECGYKVSRRTSEITSGRTKGCLTCAGKDRVKIDSGFRAVLRDYKRTAKERSLIWGLTNSELKKLCQSNCYYCGLAPSNLYYMKRCTYSYQFIYNGIDRKNNEIGYVLENCVPCCMTCNRAKCKMSLEDFLKWIKLVYDNSTKTAV